MRQLLDRYETFLADTEVAEDTLIHQFMDKGRSRKFMESASQLGDTVFQLLHLIGGDSRFYRLLVV